MAVQTPLQDNTPQEPTTTKAKKTQKVVLGPDGKPCRSCNNLGDFLGATLGTSAAAVSTHTAPECPPDVEQLGRASWTLLHSIAATYPHKATPTQQSEMKQFMTIFAKIYPCWTCAEDFRVWMSKPENDVTDVVQGRKTFGKWLCEAHNDVNVKLGKNTFDCGKWEERWRTGGKGC